eukprot:TRINITY_DN10682_c0_g1_i1.p1 TRINITY_DN10682_c0_g1~~TRINITY_DN10682_c0_g1_i1.p1  ORF type:complete len:296 (+),score=42.33 TRINITY_DN10682_c0_g1_i1:28-888(+)
MMDPVTPAEIPRPRYTAGLILYSITEAGPLILVAMDRPPHFSDFTGIVDESDNGDSLYAAARECHEETMGVFSTFETLGRVPQDTQPEVPENMESGVHYYRNKIATEPTTRINHTFERTDGRRPQVHTHFYVRVPYVPSSVMMDVRRCLLIRARDRRLPYRFLEKKDFAWVRMHEVLAAVQQADRRASSIDVTDVYADRHVHLLNKFVHSMRQPESTAVMVDITTRYPSSYTEVPLLAEPLLASPTPIGPPREEQQDERHHHPGRHRHRHHHHHHRDGGEDHGKRD